MRYTTATANVSINMWPKKDESDDENNDSVL